MKYLFSCLLTAVIASVICAGIHVPAKWCLIVGAIAFVINLIILLPFMFIHSEVEYAQDRGDMRSLDRQAFDLECMELDAIGKEVAHQTFVDGRTVIQDNRTINMYGTAPEGDCNGSKKRISR